MTNGCEDVLTISIANEDGPMLADGTVAPANCGNDDGSITGITVSGGTGMLSYEWLDGSGNPVIDGDIDLMNVPTGDYTLNVTDENGCLGTLSFNIPDTPGPEIADGTIDDASCGNADGSVTGVTVSGGTGIITYEWENAADPGTVIDMDIDLDNQPAGTYILNITDINGCPASAQYIIPDTDAPELDGGAITNASCGNADGAVFGVLVTGGIGDYTYEWTHPTDGVVGTDLDLSGVISGTYTLTVFDENMCSDALDFDIMDLRWSKA